MAKSLTYNATLVARADLEPTLGIFTVRPDRCPRRSDRPLFEPGQYVTIGLNGPGDEEAGSVRRAMSIASAPEQDDAYELYIRYVGTPVSPMPLTHLLWPLREGARLFCRPGAVGKFTLASTVGEEDPRIKVMVAAGTGLAPFLAMARSRVLRDPRARLDDFAVLHGASYPSSLGYRDELETLARNNGLRYLPTVSRPGESAEWTGCAGRVENLLAPDRLHETEDRLGLGTGGIDPVRACIFICGLQGTIANTVTQLLGRGFVPDNRRIRRALGVDDSLPPNVFWEQYDTTPVIDLKDPATLARLRPIVQAAGIAS